MASFFCHGVAGTKRSRLEQIVRRLTSDASAGYCEFFTRQRSNPEQLHRTGSVRLQCCSPERATADGVQPLSGCTESVADETCEVRCCMRRPSSR